MQYLRHYGIRARLALLECEDVDRDFSQLLLNESVILRSTVGGSRAPQSIWSFEDHLAKVKLLFLIQLKAEYEEPFIKNAPLSVSFFDKWWSIEEYEDVLDQQDILDNFDPILMQQFLPTGLPLVDEAVAHWAKRQPEIPLDHEDPAMYRVWWQGDLIGCVKEPQWDLLTLAGKWSSTINPKGKEFAKAAEEGKTYPVAVDGPYYLKGEMVKHGNRVSIRVHCATSEQ